jgi:hypothetical protein
MHLHSLSLSPDPIVRTDFVSEPHFQDIPGNITVSLAATLGTSFQVCLLLSGKVESSPLKVDLELKKGAIKIPCVDDIGSWYPHPSSFSQF